MVAGSAGKVAAATTVPGKGPIRFLATEDPTALVSANGRITLLASDNSQPAFTYVGASSSKCGFCTTSITKTQVMVMPQGTTTFQVRGTTTVYMSVKGEGRRYTTSVDGGAATSHSTSTCSCWEVDPVATNLSLLSHRIVVTNTTAEHVDPTSGPTGAMSVQAWWSDNGGFLQNLNGFNSTDSRVSYSSVNFVSDPGSDSGTLAMVPQGATFSLWVQNAANVQLELVENGAKLVAWQADKMATYTLQLANTGKYKQYKFVDWGIQPGLTKISTKVTSGTLALDRVILLQTSGQGLGVLVSPSVATAAPVLGAYGDSITMGNSTLGPTSTSDGYADRLATIRGFRLADAALGGTGAVCWGQTHVASILASHPNRVVVAFGLNDILGDYFGCPPATVDQFRSAMESIIEQLQAGLPGVPVYLGSILPTVKVGDSTRAQWNQVLQDEAVLHGLFYVDPSAALNMGTDYLNALHPNDAGAAKIASAWAAAIPTAASKPINSP